MNGMTSFLSIYSDIEQKLTKATLQLVELQEVVTGLQAENEALKRQIQAEGEKVLNESETINTQINTTSNETIHKIKEEISDIVREIDNCIGILNAE